ncbi:MAG: hypothetical protein NTW15_08780 [Burkholderiales bacterium]|nr:hypothetical protein [Burkholderiales bacterium]
MTRRSDPAALACSGAPADPGGDGAPLHAGCAELPERLARSEARLEALMRLSSDWFWALDLSLRFVRCTGGGPSADDLGRLLLGRAPWELPATTPLSGEWDDLHSLLESHRPFADFVCVTRALGGNIERRIAFSGEPTPAPGGRRIGWHGVARDVSQAHRAQERLRQLAHRDRLTGLLNRGATETALQQLLEDAAMYEAKRARRAARPPGMSDARSPTLAWRAADAAAAVRTSGGTVRLRADAIAYPSASGGRTLEHVIPRPSCRGLR